MGENQNNRKTYLRIVIVACAVVLIGMGIFVGCKLTKNDTPEGTPTENPTEAPKQTPTVTPKETPTVTPTKTPTEALTETPTVTPTETPTVTPTETPTVTPTEAPKDAKTPSSGEKAAEANEWVLYKTHEHSGEKKILDREREYFYDEQGRLTEEKCYDTYDGSIDWTYYSYDQNGEKMEQWTPETPDKNKELYLVRFTDMTGTVIWVDGYRGETYQEEYYDDGYIKEFRIYGGQSKKLEKLVKWEYDAEQKNIRRTYYKDFGNGELALVDDLNFELDSEGRVVRYVDYEDRNEDELVPSVKEYECRYEGNRRIENRTWGEGTIDECVYEGDRLLSTKIKYADGTGRIEEYFYPNVNLPDSTFGWSTYVESEIKIEADGTEIPLYKVELTDDGQPLRQIELETGEVCVEYQYEADGKLSAVFYTPWGEHSLHEMAEIKLDQYGNLVECTDHRMGTYVRYEWIRPSDAN